MRSKRSVKFWACMMAIVGISLSMTAGALPPKRPIEPAAQQPVPPKKEEPREGLEQPLEEDENIGEMRKFLEDVVGRERQINRELRELQKQIRGEAKGHAR